MAKGGHVDYRGIAPQVSSLSTFRVKTKQVLLMRLLRYKRELIQDFVEHPVTLELDAGPNSENISNTLGGSGGNANLFSFIGFNHGDRPTAIIKQVLENSINIGAVNHRGTPASALDPSVKITISYPKAKDLRPYTPMPWEPGRSWLEGIEQGISGFGEYMAKKFEAGRSKWGLQSPHTVRKSAFRPVPYYSQIIGLFEHKIRRLL